MRVRKAPDALACSPAFILLLYYYFFRLLFALLLNFFFFSFAAVGTCFLSSSLRLSLSLSLLVQSTLYRSSVPTTTTHTRSSYSNAQLVTFLWHPFNPHLLVFNCDLYVINYSSRHLMSLLDL